MRRAVLIGLAFRIASGKELEASIIATPIAISLKARRSIALAIAFSLFTFFLQLFLSSLENALKYAIRVYLIVITLGSALYSLPPEEILSIAMRLRMPRSLALIMFLTYSYIYRLTRKSIDAKLVAERKYSSLKERLRGRLIGSINSIIDDALALSEVIEVYLKTPFQPPKTYRPELIAFVITLLAQFIPFPLLATSALRSLRGLVLGCLAPKILL